MSSILVVDDEKNIRETLKDVLEDEGFSVVLADNGRKALDILEYTFIDVVLLDLWLPEIGGMEALQLIKKKYPGLQVVIISGHGTIDTAVKATKNGAFDFIEKPLSIDRILKVVEHAICISGLEQENLELRQKDFDSYYMVGGVSPQFREIEQLIENCAMSNSRVLITGENGTGKEVVARMIHMKSARRNGPFIAVNCAAIPQTLIESELFGYKKGAFTGAIEDKKGKFELAHEGTIFLDEIADMSQDAQAKVLRVLEEMQIERVGGVEPIKINVRVIAATNKDIRQYVADGLFREDLYFRLNVVPIHIPPLRERREDIPALIDYYLGYSARESTRRKKRMDGEALRFLVEEYAWTGNIREIRNLVERLTILTHADTITREDIRNNIPHPVSSADNGSALWEAGNLGLKQAKEQFEKSFIEKQLKDNDYNITKTARILKVERSNFYKLIKRLGIDTK